ncbi:MAG TPA: tyrosine-type recombinase/integrase [Myxococcus sp.]|nr:tyrosine-type recombinase/integrase [Myxococcus sp.]
MRRSPAAAGAGLFSPIEKVASSRCGHLWRADGHPKMTQVLLNKWMSRIQRLAGLKVTGGIHILRHTFCSRLAMAGAPAKAIQELAGHQNLSTTQRYMHLSPAAKSAAIRMLEGTKQEAQNGDGLETKRGDRI